MSTTSSIFRPSPEAAVLVTAPKCAEQRTDDGVVLKVEPERCETVDLSPVARNNNNPIMRFFESNFNNNNDAAQKKNETEMEEMEERSSTVKIVSPVSKRETVGGFDICREYSYSGDEVDQQHNGAAGLLSVPPLYPVDASIASLALEDDCDENVLKTHVLGKTYHPIHDYASRRDDESSLFWHTYRCDFPEIAPYNITSDAGWGCMLRSAQMMLAQALRLHYKSRDWKPPQSLSRRRQDPFIRSMLTWFADFPSSTENLYSLHNMVAAGLAKYDKLPGEWYGPGTACYVLRDLVEMHERQQAAGKAKLDHRMFRVHVTSQASVYRDVIENLMTRDAKVRVQEERERKEKECLPEHPLDIAWEEELVESANSIEWDTALLLLIPLRLGLKSFNENYVQAVAHTFSLPQSVGVLGGRPRGARWFYGAVSDGSKIFGLDPHTVQNAPRKRTARVNGKSTSIVELSDDYMRSVHTTYPEVFSLQRMDPSIALGFFCRNRGELENVFSGLREWKEAHPDVPELFTVSDTAPNYSADVSSAMDDMMISNMTGSLLDVDEDQMSDEDEYVML